MATTIQIIAALAPSATLVDELKRKRLRCASVAAQGPWQVVILDSWAPLDVFDPAVESLARDHDAVLGAAVEDGDYAYFVCLSERSSARVVIGRDAAADYKEGLWALGVADREERTAIEAISAWSRGAPRPIEGRELQDLLSAPSVDLVDVVAQLFERLSLPWPEAPSDDSSRYSGMTILLSRGTLSYRGRHFTPKRFVMGMGKGFVGIWRVAEGGEPIRRFPNDRQGRTEAFRVLLDLEGERKRSWFWGRRS